MELKNKLANELLKKEYDGSRDVDWDYINDDTIVFFDDTEQLAYAYWNEKEQEWDLDSFHWGLNSTH